MRTITMLLFCSLCQAQELPQWRYSAAALGAASVADAHSSWNRVERNPILADSQGRFSHRGVAVKGGLMAANIGVQYLLVRKWPSLARPLSYVNFSAAGITAGVAGRNYRR